MKYAVRLIVAALAASASAAASAEPPTGSRLGSRHVDGPRMSERDQREGALAMAGCIYNREPSKALALLTAQTEAAAEKAFDRMSGEKTCFNMVASNDMVDTRVVTFPMDIIRGMLAEKALSDKKKSTVGQLPPLPFKQQRYLRPWFKVTTRNAAVDEMAACIADTNPSGIMAVIATDAETKEEKAAFGAMMPSLTTCLQAGAKLQASRGALRSALADALFQRMNAPALSLEEPKEAGK